MHKIKRTQHSTTDGFIRTPLPTKPKLLRAKAVRKQRTVLIADTVVNHHMSNENQARLLFYSKLSRQTNLGPSKNYSLTKAPVSRDLSIELFAEEIETLLQNGLQNRQPETRDTPSFSTHSKRRGGVMRHISRTIRLR